MDIDEIARKREAWLNAENSVVQIIKEMQQTLYGTNLLQLHDEAKVQLELSRNTREAYFSAVAVWMSGK